MGRLRIMPSVIRLITLLRLLNGRCTEYCIDIVQDNVIAVIYESIFPCHGIHGYLLYKYHSAKSIGLAS